MINRSLLFNLSETSRAGRRLTNVYAKLASTGTSPRFCSQNRAWYVAIAPLWEPPAWRGGMMVTWAGVL